MPPMRSMDVLIGRLLEFNLEAQTICIFRVLNFFFYFIFFLKEKKKTKERTCFLKVIKPNDGHKIGQLKRINEKPRFVATSAC